MHTMNHKNTVIGRSYDIEIHFKDLWQKCWCLTNRAWSFSVFWYLNGIPRWECFHNNVIAHIDREHNIDMNWLSLNAHYVIA